MIANSCVGLTGDEDVSITFESPPTTTLAPSSTATTTRGLSFRSNIGSWRLSADPLSVLADAAAHRASVSVGQRSRLASGQYAPGSFPAPASAPAPVSSSTSMPPPAAPTRKRQRAATTTTTETTRRTRPRTTDPSEYNARIPVDLSFTLSGSITGTLGGVIDFTNVFNSIVRYLGQRERDAGAANESVPCSVSTCVFVLFRACFRCCSCFMYLKLHL